MSDQQGQDDIKNLILPEKQPIKVGNKTYYLQKLSIRQSLSLIKFIGGLATAGKDRFKDYKPSEDSGAIGNANDILKIIDILDEGEITKLFVILLNGDDNDTDNICKNLSLDIIPEIIIGMMELNDIEKLLKNFQRVVEKVTGLLKTPEK